jgi:alanyl-tRNA synthetase
MCVVSVYQMKKNSIKIVGKTEDGRNVVSGLFRIFDTRGLPLEVLFDQCEEHGMVPSWRHFYEEARSYGWKHKTIMSRLTGALTDIYGEEYCNVVLERLETIYGPES